MNCKVRTNNTTIWSIWAHTIFSILSYRNSYLFFFIIIVTNISHNPIQAQQSKALVFPAEFVRELTLPGSSNHFLRPGQVFYDSHADELFVVDQGHNRIVIFDTTGAFRFEFSVGSYCGSVADIVVNSKGTIIILGSTKDGMQVLAFDYDGTFMNSIEIARESVSKTPKIISLAIDEHNRIYLLDENNFRVIRLTAEFDYESEFSVLADGTDKHNDETVFGFMTFSNGCLWLPVSSQGTVYRYSSSGEFLGTIGHNGSKTGELNFPASVAITSTRMIVVLDKRRSMALCYTEGGKFIGEFGGVGISPGWFYYPSKITIDSEDRVCISQVFNNKVQICRIPKEIHQRLISPMTIGAITEDNQRLSFEEFEEIN